MAHYWIIAVPKGRSGDPSGALRSTLNSEYSQVKSAKFEVPDLKVGTLDALLALSDDLSKVDVQVEQITRKIASQLFDLPGNKDSALNINGTAIDTFLNRFSWDVARYPVSEAIGELAKKIRAQVGKLEDELRTKANEYHQINQVIAAEERKRAGNLVQRSLVGLVKKEHFVTSENLTTLFVVVPKFAYKDWYANYERLCEFVLPRSSSIVFEDKEHGLFSVVLFQRKVEEFKQKARESRFFVRDFSAADLESQSNDSAEARKLETSLEEQQKALLRWCRVNFAEAFTGWIHLKAIRIFVESVLRYGLPTNFQAILIQPTKKEDAKLRGVLARHYSHLGSGQFGELKGEDATNPLVNERDFYPYVYTPLDLDYAH